MFQAERPARKPTGAYLVPGTVATVTVPDALVGKGGASSRAPTATRPSGTTRPTGRPTTGRRPGRSATGCRRSSTGTSPTAARANRRAGSLGDDGQADRSWPAARRGRPSRRRALPRGRPSRSANSLTRCGRGERASTINSSSPWVNVAFTSLFQHLERRCQGQTRPAARDSAHDPGPPQWHCFKPAGSCLGGGAAVDLAVLAVRGRGLAEGGAEQPGQVLHGREAAGVGDVADRVGGAREHCENTDFTARTGRDFDYNWAAAAVAPLRAAADWVAWWRRGGARPLAVAEPVPAMPEPRPADPPTTTRLLVIGDSLTYDAADNWVRVLAGRLPGVEPYIEAHGGWTTRSYFKPKFDGVAFANVPERFDLLCLLLGSNNLFEAGGGSDAAVAEAVDGIEAIAAHVLARSPVAGVVLIAPPTVALCHYDPPPPAQERRISVDSPAWLARLGAAYRALAGRRGWGFVDLYPVLGEADFTDAAHPTAAGQAKMADAIEPAVAARLRR